MPAHLESPFLLLLLIVIPSPTIERITITMKGRSKRCRANLEASFSA